MRYGPIAGLLILLVLGCPLVAGAQGVTVPSNGGTASLATPTSAPGASTGTSGASTFSPPGTVSGAVSGGSCPPSGPIVIAPPPGFYGWVPGPYGPVPYIPPTVLITPGGGFGPIPPPVVGALPIVPTMGMGVAIEPDPAVIAAEARVMRHVLETARRQAAKQKAASTRRDPDRAQQLMTYGDRLFRADNRTRAVERYEQAIDADPSDADPRLRLAQVAVARGDYTEAANRLREAQTAEPDWLLKNPFDVQALYGEPGDFGAMLGALESHLTTHPGDRDAWLVLGAQLFLSGRTGRAADVFLRLTDRKPDPTLSAFLDASRALE